MSSEAVERQLGLGLTWLPAVWPPGHARVWWDRRGRGQRTEVRGRRAAGCVHRNSVLNLFFLFTPLSQTGQIAGNAEGRM